MISAVAISIDTAPNDEFCIFNFYRHGKPLLSAPRCLFTLRRAGSMMFDWNIPNANRAAVFTRIGINPAYIAPVKLIHSHIIYDVSPSVPADAQQLLYGREGDGVLTANSRIVPSVTGADCMPVYLYDTVTGARGIVHSGWKGTGIAGDAVSKMRSLYGTAPENVVAVLGPHIGVCCYCIDAERAQLFIAKFGDKCVIREIVDGNLQFRLSLREANIAVLEKAGVHDITYTTVCTCCDDRFGSYRREGAVFTRAAACIF